MLPSFFKQLLEKYLFAPFWRRFFEWGLSSLSIYIIAIENIIYNQWPVGCHKHIRFCIVDRPPLVVYLTRLAFTANLETSENLEPVLAIWEVVVVLIWADTPTLYLDVKPLNCYHTTFMKYTRPHVHTYIHTLISFIALTIRLWHFNLYVSLCSY